MEEKKKNKVLIFLIFVLIVLILLIIGYVVYDNFFKVEKTVLNYDNTSTSSTSTTKYIELSKEELKTASINELIKAGYEKKDLTKNIELDTYNLSYKLFDDYDGLLEENHHFDENIKQYISLENKVFNYSFSNKLNNYSYSTTIENVSKIKYEYGGDNDFYRRIFVITETGEVWYLMTNSDDWKPIGNDIDSIDKPKFIEKKGNYIDVIPLKRWDLADDYLLKTSNNKYILLSSGEEFNINTVYYYSYKNGDSMYILNNNEIYFNGEKTDIKIKNILEAGTDSIFLYYISQDNYLYDFSNPIQKYNNSKIKEIYSNFDTNLIIFEDDTRTIIEYAMFSQ